MTQSRVLGWLLLINAAMFIVEGMAGIIAESTALMADSLDMLADASVYGISLYAVGKSKQHKTRVAFFCGLLEIFMGISAGSEVVDKLLYGSRPDSLLMVVFGLLALLANIVCVVLITPFKHGDIHLRASYIFSKNDVIANLGVIISGLLVKVTHSNIPDLLIGISIALIIIQGGIRILNESRQALKMG